MVFRTFYARLGAIVDVGFFVFVVLEVLNRSRDSVCLVKLLQPLWKRTIFRRKIEVGATLLRVNQVKFLRIYVDTFLVSFLSFSVMEARPAFSFYVKPYSALSLMVALIRSKVLELECLIFPLSDLWNAPLGVQVHSTFARNIGFSNHFTVRKLVPIFIIMHMWKFSRETMPKRSTG